MTQIKYPDIHTASPSGLRHLSIVSPDNAVDTRSVEDASISRQIWGGYQSDFTLCLDDEEGNELWKIKVDVHPHEAWVSDEGWSVIRTHHVFETGLIFYSPLGERVLEIDLLHEVFDEADRQRVHDTSAGPFWATASIGYFIEIDGKSLWCIRTWWGRRIVVDLKLGNVISANEHNDLLQEAESQSVLTNLKSFTSLWSDTLQTDEVRWPACYTPTFGAAYLAGTFGLQEAVQSLRTLEDVSFSGGYRVNPGITAVELPLRQVAQLSLRRLGIEPKHAGCYTLYIDSEAIHDPAQKSMTLPEARPAARAWKVFNGMPMHDVVGEIGAPDFIMRSVWDYDYLSPQRHSLRIKWSDDDLVESVSTVCPPDWIANEVRERWMIH